jgi:hypothetical protein
VAGREVLQTTSQSTQRPNPEENHQYRHRRENIKSHAGSNPGEKLTLLTEAYRGFPRLFRANAGKKPITTSFHITAPT